MLDCHICGTEHCGICGSHVQMRAEECPRGQYLFCLCTRLWDDDDDSL